MRYPIMGPMLAKNGHLVNIGTVAPARWQLVCTSKWWMRRGLDGLQH